MMTSLGWIDIQDAMASFVLILVLVWFINREALSRQLEVDQEEAGSRQRLAMVLFLSSWVVRYLIETYECLQPAVRRLSDFERAEFLLVLKLGPAEFFWLFAALFVGGALCATFLIPIEGKNLILVRLAFILSINLAITACLSIKGLKLFWLASAVDAALLVFLLVDEIKMNFFHRDYPVGVSYIFKIHSEKSRLYEPGRTSYIFEDLIMVFAILLIGLVVFTEIMFNEPIFEHRLNDLIEWGFPFSGEILWTILVFKFSEFYSNFDGSKLYLAREPNINLYLCRLLVWGGTSKLLILLVYTF